MFAGDIDHIQLDHGTDMDDSEVSESYYKYFNAIHTLSQFHKHLFFILV